MKKIKESLNVIFDEIPLPSKTSPLVDDNLDKEEAIKETKKKKLENDIEDKALEFDEVVNVKESRNCDNPSISDVEIELDDYVELIFPYEVEGDKTPPPGDVSYDSVSSDSESEDEEVDVAPEATIGTITQKPYAIRDFLRGLFEVGESSFAHELYLCGGFGTLGLCDVIWRRLPGLRA
ncbi:hypothetical protein Tco_1069265 [Tanacetum coccineum]|uniref:Uncharacterized protein n=1 Tax=Tanacetum coccineum TaxID=301880 RepID=A0ABQ5HK92_9ASTR